MLLLTHASGTKGAHSHCALGYITIQPLQSYKSFTEVYCVISVPDFSPRSFTGAKEQLSPDIHSHLLYSVLRAPLPPLLPTSNSTKDSRASKAKRVIFFPYDYFLSFFFFLHTRSDSIMTQMYGRKRQEMVH